jgi:tRNA U34 5-methylaminomethyl-2-thiouridine-forming methyltransferase MnmC
MHHRAGALSETLYVYGEAIEYALDLGMRKFVSVGLGLGYVEWVLVASALAKGVWPSCSLRSFELDEALLDGFEAGLMEKEPTGSNVSKVHVEVLTAVSAHFGITEQRLREALVQATSQGRSRREQALTSETSWEEKADCVLYDAFSAELQPSLWTTEFLSRFLESAAAPQCLFASYASNGPLKRTLKSKGFHCHKRAGFGGKRECTLAERE